MSNRKNWQDYARTTASAALNTDFYALHWAHDVRCLMPSHGHRRVGVEKCGWVGMGSWGSRRR